MLRGDTAILDGVFDRALGFVLMLAVAEEARACKGFDVLERFPDAFVGVPELELAEARCIDHQSPVRHHDQLSMRRGMPAAPIALAHVTRALAFFAKKAVDDRRFTD